MDQKNVDFLYKKKNFVKSEALLDLSFFNFENAITAAYFADSTFKIQRLNTNFERFFPSLEHSVGLPISNILKRLGLSQSVIDYFFLELKINGSVFIPFIHIDLAGENRVYSLLSAVTKHSELQSLNGIQGQFIDRTAEWLLQCDHNSLIEKEARNQESQLEAVTQTEQRWNLALAGAKIGVFDVDLRQHNSVVSEVWLEMMQIGLLPDLTHPYQMLQNWIHPDDLADFLIAEADCIKGKTDSTEVRFRVKAQNDNWRWIQSNAVVVERSVDGDALRMVGTQRDITETIKLVQIKRDFVNTISHEIRTPLTSIKGALSLLKCAIDEAKPAAIERLLQIGTSNSDQLTNIINDLLDMKQINIGNLSYLPEYKCLNTIMKNASEEFEKYQLNAELEVALPKFESLIWIDEKKVLQVLMSLLSNACKFSDNDTTIRLAAEIRTSDVLISITNHGEGIPAELKKVIFQPFAQADSSDTRQSGGTGLGLSIAHHLIEAMGGTIGFESDPGKETTFWFTCPLESRSHDSSFAR